VRLPSPKLCLALGEARPPVRGTVNGTPSRSRLAVYGGTTYLGPTKDMCATREDARERRVAKAIEMLRDGVAHP
jgi:hypothetical protein